MSKKLILVLLVSLLVVFAAHAEKEGEQAVNKTQSGKSVFSQINLSDSAWYLRIERVNTTQMMLTAFGLAFDATKKLKFGFLLGLNDLFASLLIGPYAQYDFIREKHFSMFGAASLEFQRLNSKNGGGGNILGGIEFRIPEVDRLSFTIAYGLAWDAGIGSTLSFTNLEWLGNFGLYIKL